MSEDASPYGGEFQTLIVLGKKIIESTQKKPPYSVLPVNSAVYVEVQVLHNGAILFSVMGF